MIDWNARARAQYLSPEGAQARLDETPEPKRLGRARYMLEIARNPRNIFDLVASDIPREVIVLLEQYIAEHGPAHDKAVLKLARRHAKLEKAGHAQDTIWDILHDEAAPLGLGYGDSAFLRAVVRAARK